MKQSFFTWKNFFRSLLLALLSLGVFFMLNKIIGETDSIKFYVIMAVIFFGINFFQGNNDITWKDLFVRKNKIKR